ncbi:MAG: hypothetical protein AAGN82_03750 [Myxococcota bacterium]
MLVVATVVVPRLRRARAADFEVTGDVAAQGYDVVSPWGDVILGRRRILSTVGLSGHHLQGDYEPGEADYSARLRLRLDLDFGIANAEENFSDANLDLFIPGLDPTPVDLMYGYVEGRNLAGGWLHFKAGRQYVTDVLGWWSFDGARVGVTTPLYLKAELYGGLEQRGGLPLSTGRFESQGVWRGHRNGFENRASAFPSYQVAAPAPAVGLALESDGPNWIHGRFTYRRVWNTGAVFLNQTPDPTTGGFDTFDQTRVSSERLGYAGSAYIMDVGALRGGVAYDLLNEQINRAYGSLEFFPVPQRLTTGFDLDFYVPTFDGDSIWNWFTRNPVVTATVQASARPVDGLDVTLRGGSRVWLADGDPDTWARAQCAVASSNAEVLARCLRDGVDASQGGERSFSRDERNRATQAAPDLILDAATHYRWPTGRLGLSGTLQTGFGGAASNRGRRTGGVFSARQSLAGEIVWLGGRVSVFDWDDPLRPDRHATSFGYVLAPEWRPWRFATMRLEWEHHTNRLVGQRYRALGYVQFRVVP